jgi:hypothetical protein
MRRRALDSLRSAIEANTERRSLEQLQAQGKRHVRVVSGEKVMQIITAIVNDIIEREVGETTERDRDRIVAETKQQFDRVIQMHAEQDRLLQEQKELVAGYREKLESAVEEAKRYKEQADDLRTAQAAREARLLAEYQEQVQALAEKSRSAEGQATDLSAESKRLSEQLRELHGELEAAQATRAEAVERATKAERIIHKLDTRFEKARAALENYDRELRRVIAERDQLAADLATAREKAGESGAVSELRGELDELKAFLMQRSSGPSEETIETLLTRLAERESESTHSLEEKFSKTLDESLDKITRTMEAATAKPIEVEVAATDALVSRLFDLGDDELSSNMDDLEVEVKTSKTGILGNLQALKAMRAGQAVPQEEPAAPEAKDPPADDEQSRSGSDGNHAGPEAESTAVPAEARDKISASMERLKAVRGGKDKE